ncbi:MAG: hypothetical protein QNJ54_25620 [Prochloraceae cyanobacterium]|nr:hypothetical protein [Prochloraceae cyanobacterium]
MVEPDLVDFYKGVLTSGFGISPNYYWRRYAELFEIDHLPYRAIAKDYLSELAALKILEG